MTQPASTTVKGAAITPGTAVTIMEVAPRDGFQSVKPFIPTAEKIAHIRKLISTGVTRMEIGAFVSPKAIPQMVDINDIIAEIDFPESLRPYALVPNARGAERALEAGITNIGFVISVSESHNKANVNRTVSQSVEDWKSFVSSNGSPELNLRLNLATCFHCPFEGLITPTAAFALAERAQVSTQQIEFGICDTTGRATPQHVSDFFQQANQHFQPTQSGIYAFHGHDTYGFGIANALSAHSQGVTVFDAASAGLGGCPFAPGASGNTATEDLVFAFHAQGIETNLDLDAVLDASDQLATIKGGQTGGHIRNLPRKSLNTQAWQSTSIS